MQIRIRLLTGLCFVVEVEPSDTIRAMRAQLCEQLSKSEYAFVAERGIRLVMDGRFLLDETTVNDNGLGDQSVVHAVMASRPLTERMLLMQAVSVLANGAAEAVDPEATPSPLLSCVFSDIRMTIPPAEPAAGAGDGADADENSHRVGSEYAAMSALFL